jgi:dolichol-phosphate mannosyltransferase
MIVVDDDSPDSTADVAFALAAADQRIRCLRRVNRLGLAGAVIDGALSSSADYVAVIDGDLQHDEAALTPMFEALAAGADLAIGTRIAPETSEHALSPARQRLSDAGAWVFTRLSGLRVADPMSGFFMIRREIVARISPRLSPDGFKILIDILMLAPRGLAVVEVPYVFRKRLSGKSKLSLVVASEFLGLIAHHATAGILPIRFALFAGIGGVGLIVHFAALKTLITLGWPPTFEYAQLLATVAAMTSNFLLNNQITYRENRYRGWRKVPGLLLFYLVCSVGVGANIDVASWLYAREHIWWLAGLAGAMAGVVWNYALSTSFIWRRRSRG